MDFVALAVAIVSLGVSVSSFILTSRRYRSSDRAAATAFRAQILRKQVFVADDIAEWSVGGVHDSVRELRDDLVRALPGLSSHALKAGERAVVDCAAFLVALRPWATRGESVGQEMEQQPTAIRAYDDWKARMGSVLTSVGRDV